MDKLPILKIDPEFKDLIRPLRRKEYLQLEENILDEGCRDPIIIWNDYIIDGITAIRYALNTQFLSIPYQKILPRVKKLSFGYVKINSADEILRKKRENT